jgi:hypothetical protein
MVVRGGRQVGDTRGGKRRTCAEDNVDISYFCRRWSNLSKVKLDSTVEIF